MRVCFVDLVAYPLSTNAFPFINSSIERINQDLTSLNRSFISRAGGCVFQESDWAMIKSTAILNNYSKLNGGQPE